MNTGRTLVSLAEEITRQADAKKDYVASTTALRMVDGNKLAIKGCGEFDITEHTHNQIGERLQIPGKYYDRMRTEAPQLLAENVNTWFQQKPERRMVRTMTLERPSARAFLSDRYRPLDNFELAGAVLPELVNSNQQITIISSEITERKMYLKWTTPKVIGEVKKGDPVQAGGIITNSEIGMGALSVRPFITRLICLNGAVAEDFGQRRYHTGRAANSEEEAYELYSDDTLRKDDTAFWAKVKDTVRAVIDQTRFDKILERMREAAGEKLEGDIPEVVELIGAKFLLNEGEQKSVLRHLIEDGVGLTRYGMMQAISSAADEVPSYDRNSDLQALAGRVLTLDPKDWKIVGTTAAA
jgi:hypothetical protein